MDIALLAPTNHTHNPTKSLNPVPFGKAIENQEWEYK